MDPITPKKRAIIFKTKVGAYLPHVTGSFSKSKGCAIILNFSGKFFNINFLKELFHNIKKVIIGGGRDALIGGMRL